MNLRVMVATFSYCSSSATTNLAERERERESWWVGGWSRYVRGTNTLVVVVVSSLLYW